MAVKLGASFISGNQHGFLLLSALGTWETHAKPVAQKGGVVDRLNLREPYAIVSGLVSHYSSLFWK